MNFYSKLGFSNNPIFSDDQQKYMVWSEHIYVMLMSLEKFKSYSKMAIPDLRDSLVSYFTLTIDSLNTLNEIVESGLKAGGKEPISMIDEGFMQIRRILDFDGHTWDIIYLDNSKFSKE